MSRKTTFKKCLECNKTFYPAISEIKRGNGKFCSLSCVCHYRNKHYIIRNIKTTLKTCNFCGKRFEHRPYKGEGRFCSQVCLHNFQRGQNPGHPNQNIRRKLKEIAFIKYGNICEVCSYALAVDVHHLVPRALGGNDSPNNLAVLCPNHHREIHIGILTKEDIRKIRQHVEMEGYEPSSKITPQKLLQA